MLNMRLCGGDTWRVRARGPATFEGDVVDNGNGTYTVSYTAKVAGLYSLHITNGAGLLVLISIRLRFISTTARQYAA